MKDRIRASLESMDYHRLMQRRINRILLICSSYDAYILEEDGRLDLRINQEYRELNLTHTPSFVRVSTTAEALEVLAEQEDIDLVISISSSTIKAMCMSVCIYIYIVFRKVIDMPCMTPKIEASV
jgi:hypothetical protein